MNTQAEREEKREAANARITALKEMNTHLRYGQFVVKVEYFGTHH